jgi:hypothetical protein
VKLSENLMFHDRSKHIEIKYYFLDDKVHKGKVILQYISTDEQKVDILTKPLSKIKFAYLRDKLGLIDISPLVEKGGDDFLGWEGVLIYGIMDSQCVGG